MTIKRYRPIAQALAESGMVTVEGGLSDCDGGPAVLFADHEAALEAQRKELIGQCLCPGWANCAVLDVTRKELAIALNEANATIARLQASIDAQAEPASEPWTVERVKALVREKLGDAAIDIVAHPLGCDTVFFTFHLYRYAVCFDGEFCVTPPLATPDYTAGIENAGRQASRLMQHLLTH